MNDIRGWSLYGISGSKIAEQMFETSIGMSVYSFVAWQQKPHCFVFAWCGPNKTHSFPYIIVPFLRGVFAGRRMESVVFLLSTLYVPVRMFTEIPLLL
jgi:hypothetical protein